MNGTSRQWLLERAGYPIRYALTRDPSLIGGVLESGEVRPWLARLSDRAARGDLSDIHGSHDYRFENIAGKCFVLGLDAAVPPFDAAMRFYVEFLARHIDEDHGGERTFGRMYRYRDYETVLACYLPFLGYAREDCVRYVAEKRADVIYGFTKKGRYDVYRPDLPYPGAKKEWKPHILDPALYEDGNIAFPSIHDLILFAGMLPYFDAQNKAKVETTVRWLFGEGYSSIHGSLYYYAPDDPSYKSKGINSKIRFPDTASPGDGHAGARQLLLLCFLLSRFDEGRSSEWFSRAVAYLERHRTGEGRYLFPKEMLREQKDEYVWAGGHMNAGESKKTKIARRFSPPTGWSAYAKTSDRGCSQTPKRVILSRILCLARSRKETRPEQR